MTNMRFPKRWRKWITDFISIISKHVLVNGSLIEEFKFGRNLRQCDPLSPFLFLIFAEGLTEWCVPRSILVCSHGTGYKMNFTSEFLTYNLRITLCFLREKLGEYQSQKGHSTSFFNYYLILKVNFHKSLLIGLNVSES